jgi:hypothetical protein
MMMSWPSCRMLKQVEVMPAIWEFCASHPPMPVSIHGHSSRILIYSSSVSNHIISYHIISYHIISYHIISYHIIIISYHIISYHIISYHIISYHIISYHIISYHHIQRFRWNSLTISLIMQAFHIITHYTPSHHPPDHLYMSSTDFPVANSMYLWVPPQNSCS